MKIKMAYPRIYTGLNIAIHNRLIQGAYIIIYKSVNYRKDTEFSENFKTKDREEFSKSSAKCFW